MPQILDASSSFSLLSMVSRASRDSKTIELCTKNQQRMGLVFEPSVNSTPIDCSYQKNRNTTCGPQRRDDPVFSTIRTTHKNWDIPQKFRRHVPDQPLGRIPGFQPMIFLVLLGGPCQLASG